MAYTAIPAASGAQGAADYARGLAQAALGVSGTDLLFDFYPIYVRGTTGMAGVMTGSSSQTGRARAQRLSTGATAGSLNMIMPFSNNTTSPRLFEAGAAKKIWVAGRFALVGATIVSGDRAGISLYDSAAGWLATIGAHGASSTANFVAFADTGGFINSGRALDTVMRLHQFYRNGTTGIYTIDNDAPVTGNVRPSANTGPIAEITNGAAATREMDLEWFAAAAVRE